MIIHAIGDVHGEWNHLNKHIDIYKPDILFICGDFGWWPHFHGSTKFDGSGKPWNQYGIINPSTKIYWCDGNHENHDDLDNLVSKHGIIPIEIMKDVYYMPRGSVLTINNKNVLFFGGANSIDKNSRIQGVTWWPQEVISYTDFQRIGDIYTEIDVVVSHTCPESVFDHDAFKKKVSHYELENDPSRTALQAILEIYHPSVWVSGHWHDNMNMQINNTSFHIIDCIYTNNYLDISSYF
jgi:Icc-related predicted phosphoesterase